MFVKDVSWGNNIGIFTLLIQIGKKIAILEKMIHLDLCGPMDTKTW
jgi:hypothetical protein